MLTTVLLMSPPPFARAGTAEAARASTATPAMRVERIEFMATPSARPGPVRHWTLVLGRSVRDDGQIVSDADSTVLVTGGTGFLGGWCVVELLRRGHTVRTTVRDLK